LIPLKETLLQTSLSVAYGTVVASRRCPLSMHDMGTGIMLVATSDLGPIQARQVKTFFDLSDPTDQPLN
jgi:hypothetical protein